MLLTALALDVLVLSGGTVHTLVPDEAPFPATVVIEDGRLRSIVRLDGEGGAEPAPELEIPEDAEVVDVSGLHLVPGLIDAMVNFDPEHDPLYVASGITLVRDIGNFPARVLAAREHRDRGPGPAVQTAGVALDAGEEAGSEAYRVETLDDAAHAVPNLKHTVEADFVCIQHGLSKEVWREVARLAHASGLEVWGPIPTAVPREDVPGVQDGVFYLDALLPPGVDWSFVQPGAFAGLAERLAAEGTRIVPLLMGVGYRLRDPAASGGQQALDRLSPYYESWWLNELAGRKRVIDELGEGYIKQGGTVIRKQLALVKQLHDAGVALVPGSAAPNPWLSPGWGLHDELALLAEAGIPPGEVLALATREAARALGVGEERGTLEEGKVADVLVLAGDPREDLKHVRRPAGLVLRGRLLPAAELRGLEEAEVRRQAAAREKLRRPLELPAPTLPAGEVLLSGEVETVSRGLRISAERWAIVRLPSGARAYCSRMLTPGDGVFPDADLEIRQVVRDGRIEEFEVTLHQGEQALTARGLWAAQTFRVERRLDGAFLANDTLRQHAVALDLGSITTILMIADAAPSGVFTVVEMRESLEPVAVSWEMLEPTQAEREDGSVAQVLLVRTHEPRGLLAWEMAPDGSVRLWETHLGDNVSYTVPVRREAGEAAEGADAGEPAEAAAPAEPAGDDALPPEGGEQDDAPPESPEESGPGDDPGDGGRAALLHR